MPRITVTDRAYEMILRHVQSELRGTARRRNDGRWEVSLSDELDTLLDRERFPNETKSQTILRYLPTRTGGGR